MLLVPGYKAGSDITLMNTFYQFPEKQDDGKWSKDTITLIYKDNRTGIKNHVTIEEPSHEFYTIHDDKVDKHYQPFFMDIKDCDKHEVPHNKIEKELSILTHNEEFYNTNIKIGNRRDNARLHAEPNVLFSDTNIEDHYRYLFSKSYTNNISKVYKGFFDIEVDGKYQKGDFPEPGECPINCCSYFDEKTNKVYTFILRNVENPLIEDFEKSVGPKLFKEIKEFVIDAVGGWKKATKYGVIDTEYELRFFDDEISLIKNMFDTFHEIDPDFILVWNMEFDLPYIIERCKVLGYDPKDILCSKYFKNKVVKFYADTKNKSMPAERTDYFNLSGNIVWLDQMIQYASKRKSKIGSYKSLKLDDIGLLEAKVRKLSYHHITDSIIKLPYLDFKTFVFYNIMDVVVQKCIEAKCLDVDYVFTKTIMNNTSYRKIHRQTVYLINRISNEFFDEGLVIGNNCNKWNEKIKFEGALVPDPSKTDGYSKIKIHGRPVMVADNCLDQDYRSLYPSITLEHNCSPNTMIGAIVIPEKIYDNENYYKKELYNRGGEFIENMVTDNVLEFSHRYFHLATFKEFLTEDLPEFINMGYMRSTTTYNNAVYFLPQYANMKQEAIHFHYTKNAIKFFDVEPLDFAQYRETLREKAGL